MNTHEPIAPSQNKDITKITSTCTTTRYGKFNCIVPYWLFRYYCQHYYYFLELNNT